MSKKEYYIETIKESLEANNVYLENNIFEDLANDIMSSIENEALAFYTPSNNDYFDGYNKLKQENERLKYELNNYKKTNDIYEKKLKNILKADKINIENGDIVYK